jgi:hypothetical protein
MAQIILTTKHINPDLAVGQIPSLNPHPLSAKVPPSQPPGAGESGVVSATEGATGPRKRSGNRDRAGNRDLWKAGARGRACRTDGVRDQRSRISQVPRQRGVTPPAFRRRQDLVRRPEWQKP